jgi:hypothetical protein
MVGGILSTFGCVHWWITVLSFFSIGALDCFIFIYLGRAEKRELGNFEK